MDLHPYTYNLSLEARMLIESRWVERKLLEGRLLKDPAVVEIVELLERIAKSGCRVA